ncbi:MAG: hypothetical protein B7Z30_17705 [Rhizobiales bacterium 12-68-15]|nr:MAG: hypothetical protein B7Z30_17705 [Rhizobiales bacterium 12-68-15]
MSTSLAGAPGVRKPRALAVGALALGALALGTLALGGPALAQTSTVIETQPSGYVLVQPQKEMIVQQYVVGQPGAMVTLQQGYEPAAGSTVPATVELRTFQTGVDGGFDASGYRYVVTPDAGTLLVEPETRRVIQVIR